MYDHPENLYLVLCAGRHLHFAGLPLRIALPFLSKTLCAGRRRGDDTVLSVSPSVSHRRMSAMSFASCEHRMLAQND